jgi:hypothetical protein
LQRVEVGHLTLVFLLVVLLPEVVGSAVEEGCLGGIGPRAKGKVGELRAHTGASL